MLRFVPDPDTETEGSLKVGHHSSYAHLNGYLEGYYIDYIQVGRVNDVMEGSAVIYFRVPHEEEKMECKYVNNRKNGKAVLYDKNGICMFRSSFINDVIEGECEMYEDGILSFSGTISNDNINGYGYKQSKGVLLYEGYYKDGKKHGIGREYNEDGSVLSDCVYKNGKKLNAAISYDDEENCIMYLYDDNDNVTLLGMIEPKTGVLTGLGCRFHPDGTVSDLVRFSNDAVLMVLIQFHGDEMTEFDKNGDVVYKGGYKMISDLLYKRHGEGTAYDGSQEIVYKGGYKDGYRCGKGKEFKKGVCIYEGEWSMDQRNGQGCSYLSGGVVEYNGTWKNGECVDILPAYPPEASVPYGTIPDVPYGVIPENLYPVLSAPEYGTIPDQITTPEYGTIPDQVGTSEYGTIPDQVGTSEYGTIPDQITTPEYGTIPDQIATPDYGIIPDQVSTSYGIIPETTPYGVIPNSIPYEIPAPLNQSNEQLPMYDPVLISTIIPSDSYQIPKPSKSPGSPKQSPSVNQMVYPASPKNIPKYPSSPSVLNQMVYPTSPSLKPGSPKNHLMDPNRKPVVPKQIQQPSDEYFEDAYEMDKQAKKYMLKKYEEESESQSYEEYEESESEESEASEVTEENDESDESEVTEESESETEEESSESESSESESETEEESSESESEITEERQSESEESESDTESDESDTSEYSEKQQPVKGPIIKPPTQSLVRSMRAPSTTAPPPPPIAAPLPPAEKPMEKPTEKPQKNLPEVSKYPSSKPIPPKPTTKALPKLPSAPKPKADDDWENAFNASESEYSDDAVQRFFDSQSSYDSYSSLSPRVETELEVKPPGKKPPPLPPARQRSASTSSAKSTGSYGDLSQKPLPSLPAKPLPKHPALPAKPSKSVFHSSGGMSISAKSLLVDDQFFGAAEHIITVDAMERYFTFFTDLRTRSNYLTLNEVYSFYKQINRGQPIISQIIKLVLGEKGDRVYLKDFAIISHLIYLYNQGFPVPSHVSEELQNCAVFRYVSDNLSDPFFNKPPYISIYQNKSDLHFAEYSQQPTQVPLSKYYTMRTGDVVISNASQLSLLRTSHSVVMQGRDLMTLSALECMDGSMLRSLVVGHSVGASCNVFRVMHMPHLEQIIVGEDSFTICHRNDVNNVFANFDRISKQKKVFTISDCPVLNTIQVGNNSFSDFSSFSLSNLPLLQTLEIGKSLGIDSYDNRCYSFFKCREIQLVNLPFVTSVSIGNFGFYFCESALFQDLPALEKLSFGQYAFFKTTYLSLSNLPKCTELLLNPFAFYSCESFTGIEISSVSSVILDMNCFYLLKEITKRKISVQLSMELSKERKYRPKSIAA